MKSGKRTGVLLAAALLAAASGCSSKAPAGGGGAAGGGRPNQGVQGNEITLGVLTDLTGVFAALGNDITNAHTMYWEKVNNGQKVCGKYTVKLNIKDTNYNPQQGVQLYSGMQNEILAMQQTIGSPINTALEQQYTSDKMVNLPSAWARNLTIPPGNGVVGATYDIEMVNALDYALDEGLIKKGDKLGHIYFEGEYGANGLAGAKHFAERNDMEIVEAKIKATDQDMSPQITQFKGAGVKGILLTVAPGQTASAAGAAAAQGLDVPIVGNNPVFVPGLLNGPAADALKKNLIFASPTNSFSEHEQLLQDYKKKYPNATNPSLGVIFGTGMSDVMKQIIEKACATGGGTPTRQGMVDAKNSLSNVDTDGLVVPLDYTVGVGKSPSKKSYIIQPADVPGGAKVLTEEPIESPAADGLA